MVHASRKWRGSLLGLALCLSLPLSAFAATTPPAGAPQLPAGTRPAMGTMPEGGGMTGPAQDNQAIVLLQNCAMTKVLGTDALLDENNAKAVLRTEKGRTMVPASFVETAFGCTVSVGADQKTVTVRSTTASAILTVGSLDMTANGTASTLDVGAKVFDGTVWLPLRAVAEKVFGKTVGYSKGLVYISDTVVALDEMKVTILTGMLSGQGMSGGPMGGSGGGAPGESAGGPDTSAITNKYLDVSYASVSDAEKLDIYLPESGSGPFPVIIQIHGGAFKSGDKASGELTPALQGIENGYAVVAVNYRLSSEAKSPAQINDIKAAIRFLRANAAKYNLDPERFAVWGGSAGGSLAALAGTSGDVAALEDLTMGNAEQSSRVQAVVDWFGPIYFSTMDAEFAALGVTPVGVTSQSGSPESAYIGGTVGEAASEPLVIKASPQTYITSDDPAFFIQHGTADKNIPIPQSVNFSNKLKAALGEDKVTFRAIEGAGHGTSEFTTDANVKLVFDFLDAQLK